MSDPSTDRPNVVFIVADDHGREALGCYGNAAVKTPHLDALAAEGVRFDNAFCTTPSCAASRSVILTGLHNHTNGTYGHTHGPHHFSCFPNVRSLPSFLNEAGYRTACIGKKHFAPADVFPFSKDLGDPCGRDDVRMAEACRDLLEGPSPFLLYWCSHNPHRAEVLENHPLKPNSFGNPSQSFPCDQEELFNEADVLVPPWLPDTPEVRAELAQYWQSIARLDRGVGRLVELLKETGQYENTLIVYVSDNGAAFPASKTTFYDPGIRLPCIVRPPRCAIPGSVRDELIAWYDWIPTILDFAGVANPPDNLFGKSIRPLLGEPSGIPWREEIYAAHTFHEITNYYPMRAVCTAQYKFIWNIASPLPFSFASDLWRSASWKAFQHLEKGNFGCRPLENFLHRPRFELYDVVEDPNEIHNLAGQMKFQTVVEEFCEKIRSFQKKTKDPWLTKWEHE